MREARGTCFEKTCAADAIFSARNGHLELQDPPWWNDPASERQILYLVKLLDERIVPDELRAEIDANSESATKGNVSQWLAILATLPWMPRTAENHGTATAETIH